MAAPQLLNELAAQLQKSSSSGAEDVKSATEWLKACEDATPTMSLALLQLIASEMPAHLKLACAIQFKNTISRRWGSIGFIPKEAREQLKSGIVDLVLTTPRNVRKQLTEALIFMANEDFPDQWPALLPQLVAKYTSQNFEEVYAALKATCAILMRFRQAYDCPEVIGELAYILPIIEAPLLQLCQTCSKLVDQHASDPKALEKIFKSLGVVFKIFYCLTYVDIPAFFEDNLDKWAAEFHKFLAYRNKHELLYGDNDDTRPGLIHKVQSYICENITLFTQKYEVQIKPFTTVLIQDVWNILTEKHPSSRFDPLISHCLHYLNIISTGVFHAMVSDADTLKRICEQIVIPNSIFTEDDEMNFEEDADEYIRRDIEGNDTLTRRRSACDLVRGLCEHNNEAVTSNFGGYITNLLQQYAADPKANWRQKDVAIYLVIALSATGGNAYLGATKTNALIPIMDFFSNAILPELTAYPNNHPVIQADALKFITTFRNQLQPKEVYLQVFGACVNMVKSEQQVVRTYAVNALEKMLLTRNDGGDRRISRDDIAPHLKALFGILFEVVDDNEYVMRAVMRIISVGGPAVLPYTETLLAELHKILTRVSKDVRNPNFNHCLFESLAALTEIISLSAPQNITQFEKLMYPLFQHILNNDIAEFAPYVFQLVAMLIERCPTELNEEQLGMLRMYHMPMHWTVDKAGNIPALARVLTAYIMRCPAHIAKPDQLEPLLGIFQKLLSSTLNDKYGFELLDALVEYVPLEAYKAHVPTVFKLVFARLSDKKTQQLKTCFICFLSKFILKHSVDVLVGLMDQVQPGIFQMVLNSVWASGLNSVLGDYPRKVAAFVTINLVTKYPPLASLPALDAPGTQLWKSLVEALVSMLAIEVTRQKMAHQIRAQEEAEIVKADSAKNFGYSTTYVPLYHCKKPAKDPLPQVADVGKYFVAELGKFKAANEAKVTAVLAQLNAEDAKSL
eukprot:CAMPEP_0114606120 /NCGR_PEP_ID=MMETSP0168-20121206/1400_1 /TAXON_ID=95228 ORGANISM="Vannella sp., Strain DIVA3 517/6/12" /NCGR_SAMPLE_ID=MMETSP0168 /ASSEMBLY_ACC=CAM_ASM_000044 /LENGTH=964 /DNA_ID=CAMNT_0001816979 /DNA_START=133 /DNA_END=3023 /DNA_ORIENTATION=+